MPRVVSAGVPEPDAAGDERRLRVVGDRVLVDGDVRPAEQLLRRLARQVLGPQVDQHQVGVGAAGDDREAAFDQGLGERLGVGDHLLRVALEVGRQRLAEGDRLGGDDVLERPALRAGEDRLVDRLGELRRSQRIMPARGPRSVLCVVLVTTCACGTGEG